jgi:catechol 2,3-dioxygenase-like lactoylglutathione lyase family enzyme
MSLSPAALDSAYRQAERALRKPSSAVWLRGVALRTSRFDEALQFYTQALGLTLGDVGADPLSARVRAQMLDAEGRPVLQLVESDGDAGGVRELAFGMPRRTVALLRSRLGLQGVRYTDAGGALYVEDPDGTTLRVEAL